MWFIVVADGYFGKEYIECDSLEEALQRAEDFENDHLKLYNYVASTQILKVTDEI